MKIAKKTLLIAGLVGLLVLIRAFEHRFFYDPFMYFFEKSYVSSAKLELPVVLYLNLVLRYWLNAAVSLGILYVTFQDRGILKFSKLLYLLFFLVLFPLFIYLMHHTSPGNYLPVFYVRRFLAHPLLLLLLLPAFFYQRIKDKKDPEELSKN